MGMLLTIALGALSPRARAAPSDDEAAIVKGIECFEKLLPVAKEANGDCDRLVASMVRWLEENEATLKELKAVKARMSEAQSKALKTKYGARLDAAAKELAKSVGRCDDSPAAKNAAKKLQGTF